ncbi:hypothetical protein E0Z10_g4894 [Xylaria hypoxylon]|uniref:Uncharacterized protein n=1 Tax=Xylaria hypoxylon TaxID=37992 RepID=A0A4Z0YHS8_9PEZI|nr:hypothetical protein E0Z10_g4894 [Xylaria hypoxylon]
MQPYKGLGGAANSTQTNSDGGEKGKIASATPVSETQNDKASQSSQPSDQSTIIPPASSHDGDDGPKKPSDGGYGGSTEVQHSDPIDIKKR